MSDQDRLSALMSRFALTVTPVTGEANLFVTADGAEPSYVILSPQKTITPDPGQVVFRATVNWGGALNPLVLALPDLVKMDLRDDPDTAAVARVLQSEGDALRCGAGSVLNRLAEVLIVRMLRQQIERGEAAVGLLGGLADPRLSRAIVAMHEAPGRQWTMSDLAGVTGLSVSRFGQLFHDKVGETPFAYLRRWRMGLARQDLARGHRVQDVAHRYGYGAPEALSRAFTKAFGETPIDTRKRHSA